jgi:hypothetical protein
MNRAQQDFTPRSESAWAALCTAALPSAALQILREAHAAGGYQVDAADAWIALQEQKTEAQTRSRARRAEVKGWGTCARAGEAEQGDQIDHTTPPGLGGLGEWTCYQDPADALEALEIRAAIEACDALQAIKALGLGLAQQDPAAVGRLNEELRRWAALDDIAAADSSAIAARDHVGLRMAQMALRARREAIAAGQGVLFLFGEGAR